MVRRLVAGWFPITTIEVIPLSRASPSLIEDYQSSISQDLLPNMSIKLDRKVCLTEHIVKSIFCCVCGVCGCQFTREIGFLVYTHCCLASMKRHPDALASYCPTGRSQQHQSKVQPNKWASSLRLNRLCPQCVSLVARRLVYGMFQPTSLGRNLRPMLMITYSKRVVISSKLRPKFSGFTSGGRVAKTVNDFAIGPCCGLLLRFWLASLTSLMPPSLVRATGALGCVICGGWGPPMRPKPLGGIYNPQIVSVRMRVVIRTNMLQDWYRFRISTMVS